MESERQQPVAGLSAPYGQACAGCAKAKCKCVSRGNGTCERCHRRGVECRTSDGVRKRSARRPNAGSHRTSQLEERLNDLVEILRSQNSGSAQKRTSPSQGSESVPEVLNQVQPSGSASVNGTVCGAYLTPQTGIASSTSHAGGDPTVKAFDDDDLSVFEAENILQKFRNEHLLMFPFVYIKPDVTAQQLQQYRPFLWLNIRTVCEKSAPRLHVLGTRIREDLGRKVLVELERDIDVLLGLMVYLGWSAHQTRGKSFQARYANLANSLIQDLRLDRPSHTSDMSTCLLAHGSKLPAVPEETHEQRRAVIGTFILCSTISNFLRKEVTRWTPHMEEMLEKLASDPECSGDEALVIMARIKLIIEDIARVTWKRPDYEVSGSPWLYIKPLRDRLQQIKRLILPDMPEHKILMSHIYNAEVIMTEVVIFHPSLPMAIPLPHASYPTSIPVPSMRQLATNPTQTETSTSTPAPPPTEPPALNPIFKPIDIPRLQILYECLQATKHSISSILSFAPAQYVSFPFSLMCHMTLSLQTLYRLTQLGGDGGGEPGWDSAAVRREADVIAVLHQLADRMGQVAAAAGLVGDPTTPCGDMFTKGLGTLRATAAIWATTLPPLVTTGEEGPGTTTGAITTTPMPGFGGVDSAVSGTAAAELDADNMAMMMDFSADPWLTDLFTSWE